MNPEPLETSAETPEADLLDQLAPADPGDDAPDPEPLATASEPVNEADWAEHQREVPLDDESETVGPGAGDDE